MTNTAIAFDAKEHKQLLAYAATVLKNKNCTKFEAADIVNEIYFEPENAGKNLKGLVIQTVNKYLNKNEVNHTFEYTPKFTDFTELKEKQCTKCMKLLPINFFTIDKASNTYKKQCKSCRVVSEKDAKQLRRLKEMKSEILVICDFLQQTISQFKNELNK